MKTCTKCQIAQPFASFYKRKNKPCGFQPSCKSCANKAHKERVKRNPEPTKRANAKCYQKHKEIRDINTLAYYHANKAQASETNRKSRLKYLEARRQYSKNYKTLHSAEHNERQRRRTASKTNATPRWITIDQINEMREIYRLAKELSWLSESPLEVDHIVPIQGKTVCGLHVPWNLQILPETLNRSKSNRLVG